jgi:hypothetical protein
MKARLLVACALFGCAQGAQAPAETSAVSAPDASVAVPSIAAPGHSGAAVDAAPADAMKPLRHALSHSMRNVNIERRSGRLYLDVAGTFQTATVITFDKDGHANKRCLDNAAELDRMLGESP